jgi:hypothetical protein
MSSIETLCEVLRAKTGFEAVNVDGSDNHIFLLGRLPQNRQPTDLLIVSHQLMVESLLKGRRLLHAWRLVFEGVGIDKKMDVFIRVVKKTPNAAKSGQVDSVELPCANRSRNWKRGKGAVPTGQAQVGPNHQQSRGEL